MADRGAEPYVSMVMASMVFTGMAEFAHAAGARCSWQWVMLARASVALVLVACVARWRGRWAFTLGTPTLWLRSIAGSLSMLCTFYALTRRQVPVSNTMTLTNTFPIWVAVFSWVVFRERARLAVWLAIACATAGVWFIHQPQFEESDIALACALAASVLSAIAMLGLHRLRGLDTSAIVVHFSAVATCAAVASLFVFDREPIDETKPALELAGFLLGVGMTAACGQVLLTRAFTGGDPARVSVLGLTQVLFTLSWDTWVLGRELSGERILGICLVVVPTAWVMLARPPVQ